MAKDSAGGGKPRDYDGFKNVKQDGRANSRPGFDFIKGGPDRSHPKHTSGSQEKGITSQEGRGSGDWAQGGHGNHMFPQTAAGPMPAGQTGRSLDKGTGEMFAQGGKGHMFGRRGSQRRSPGDTGGM
jgi:hypothetical protein